MQLERARTETMALTAAGLACALASSAAFWLHMIGLVPMPFFVNVFGLPVIILMLIIGLFSWQRQLSFWIRLRAGFVAGAAALAAYDLVRLLIYTAFLPDFYPFQSHRIFGHLITGQPPASEAAAVTGWIYHFWNGFQLRDHLCADRRSGALVLGMGVGDDPRSGDAGHLSDAARHQDGIRLSDREPYWAHRLRRRPRSHGRPHGAAWGLTNVHALPAHLALLDDDRRPLPVLRNGRARLRA